ncbi:hypothetical protein [Floridanema aerugineum]|uniref:Uncharacterized protein n=1 Tax=Floridaenema aerugineum BLCC-F46 TaxID=3153654 RepID=A0ABV4X1X6_9CYAN
MRYAIMLQIVGIITIILLGTAGLFAWLQQRPTQPQNSAESTIKI